MGLPAFVLPKTTEQRPGMPKKISASGYTCPWALDDRLHVVDEGREGRERYLSLRVICPCSNMRGAAKFACLRERGGGGDESRTRERKRCFFFFEEVRGWVFCLTFFAPPAARSRRREMSGLR